MAAVRIREPGRSDEAAFIAAVRRSRKLHGPWVAPPDNASGYRDYLRRLRGDRDLAYFILTADGELAGVVNLSEIVRGLFRNAYLGYYALTPHAGCGLMRAGMSLVISRAFGKHRLHRLEANIQPENVASSRLVRRLGFDLEGYSPRYLKIGGRWRDHERWALLSDNWKPGSLALP